MRPPITWPGLARRARRFRDSQKLNTHSEPPEVVVNASTEWSHDSADSQIIYDLANFLQPRSRAASI